MLFHKNKKPAGSSHGFQHVSLDTKMVGFALSTLDQSHQRLADFSAYIFSVIHRPTKENNFGYNRIGRPLCKPALRLSIENYIDHENLLPFFISPF